MRLVSSFFLSFLIDIFFSVNIIYAIQRMRKTKNTKRIEPWTEHLRCIFREFRALVTFFIVNKCDSAISVAMLQRILYLLLLHLHLSVCNRQKAANSLGFQSENLVSMHRNSHTSPPLHLVRIQLMYVSLNERRKSSWAVDHMRYGCVYVYDYAVSAWEGRERESEEEWNKKKPCQVPNAWLHTKRTHK